MIEPVESFIFGTLLSTFVDDLIFEACIDMVWSVRTGGYSLDEIYNVDPIETYFAKEKQNENQPQSGVTQGTVNCPICSELVAGRRFAPHLEKCMNGGKRGSKRNYDYLHDESFGKPVASKPPKLAEVTIPDPYPNSLVIRIKFKNKVPRANQKRVGASMEEFMDGEVGCTHVES